MIYSLKLYIPSQVHAFAMCEKKGLLTVLRVVGSQYPVWGGVTNYKGQNYFLIIDLSVPGDTMFR